MNRSLLSLCLILCGTAHSGAQEEGTSSSCLDPSVQGQRITLKHREANGIGYNTGYTSLDLFLGTATDSDDFIFLDARGHVLNNGTFATNAGVGMRYLTGNTHPVVMGINAYYDYRQVHRLQYNQIGLGLEALGSSWEARLNSYLPVGKKNRLERTTLGGPIFQYFSGHYLYIDQGRARRYEFPLAEIDAEVGRHFRPDKTKDIDFYVGIGPYYLRGHYSPSTAGFAGRLACSFNKYVSLTANYSYDRLFKNIVQGEVAISIPFGSKKKLRTLSKTVNCDTSIALNQRLAQDVYRQEIIPLKHHTKNDLIGPTVAINPVTGQPYYFVFVNNTSHSNGTFESPYPTLLLAQNNSSPYNIIYVYPGDGTTTGMAVGITLQESQMMWGASIAHPLLTTLSPIPLTVPPLASVLPNITNAAGSVVRLANNNMISGFHIAANTGNGITGTGISNLTVDQNTIVTTTSNSTNGVNLLNPLGQVFVTNSTFNGFAQRNNDNNGNGVYVELDTSTLTTLSVVGSSFTNIDAIGSGNGGAGIFAFVNGGTLSNLNVSTSTFNTIGNLGTNLASGVLALANAGTMNNIDISACAFSNIMNSSGGAVIYANGGRINNANMAGSTFDTINNGGSGAVAFVNGGTIGNWTASNNVFSNIYNSSNGIFSVTQAGTLSALNAVNNTFSNISNSANGIASILVGGTVTNIITSGNSFNTFDNTATGIFVQGGVGNVSVADSTFNNLTNGSEGVFLQVGSGAAFGNLNVLRNTFTNINGTTTPNTGSQGVFVYLNGGTVNSVSVAANQFSNIDLSSEGVLFQTNAVGDVLSQMSFSGNTFNNIGATNSGTSSYGIIGIMFGGKVNQMSVVQNTFSQISVKGIGLQYLSENAVNSTSLKVSSNNFINNNSVTSGWGAAIEVDNGTACLNFTGNNATPSHAPNPYNFTRTGGTFRVESSSGNITAVQTANNNATIDTSGTITYVVPGTCP